MRTATPYSPTSERPVSLATCKAVVKDPGATGRLGEDTFGEEMICETIGTDRHHLSATSNDTPPETYPKRPSQPCPILYLL